MRTLKKFPWLYLVLAYGWAWMCWIPVALSGQDYQASPWLFAVVFAGIAGPGLAGILLARLEASRGGSRDYWQRALDFRRIRPGWIVFMLLLWPSLQLFANTLSRLLGGQVPASELVDQISARPVILPVVVLLYFLQAAIEDLGWRGYMLEKLLHSWSPLKAALLVGVFHAFWHLPLFWVAGTNQIKMGIGLDFWLFVVQAIAFSVYASWCYVDNRHSTLAAVLMHTIGNLCNDIFALMGSPTKFQLYTLIMVVGALVLGLIFQFQKGQVEYV
jgi:membrane protease YdiL (CAAX protease family)